MFQAGYWRMNQRIYIYNTKSTDAQGILKPKSVISREEGGLGFLMINGIFRTLVGWVGLKKSFSAKKKKIWSQNA